jgi:hypothetical protein
MQAPSCGWSTSQRGSQWEHSPGLVHSSVPVTGAGAPVRVADVAVLPVGGPAGRDRHRVRQEPGPLPEPLHRRVEAEPAVERQADEAGVLALVVVDAVQVGDLVAVHLPGHVPPRAVAGLGVQPVPPVERPARLVRLELGRLLREPLGQPLRRPGGVRAQRGRALQHREDLPAQEGRVASAHGHAVSSRPRPAGRAGGRSLPRGGDRLVDEQGADQDGDEGQGEEAERADGPVPHPRNPTRAGRRR